MATRDHDDIVERRAQPLREFTDIGDLRQTAGVHFMETALEAPADSLRLRNKLRIDRIGATNGSTGFTGLRH